MNFTHESFPQRVVFASGEAPAAVAAELEAQGLSTVMLIASNRGAAAANPITAVLAARGVRVVRHDEVVMHVPVEVADRARTAAELAGADAVLSVGGGSATGLGKAVALTTGLPLIAVPTSYSGSEATNVWGVTEPGPNGGTKTTGVHSRVLPASIVYDASLLATLPNDVAVSSGLNALAHGIDSMWGPRGDPIDRALAQEGIRALAEGLPLVAGNTDGADCVEGIEQTLYGAYFAAISVASAGSGIHHKICHVLGGMFNLPHAQTHAVVLPHVLSFNAPCAPEAERRIAQAFGSKSAVAGLAALRKTINAPKGLKDYGMPEDGIAKAVAPILSVIPNNNPAAVDANNLTALLRAAWEGDEPV